MSDIEEAGNYELMEDSEPNWKAKVLIIGAVGGALVGLGAAFLFIQNSEDDTQSPEFTAGKGLKIGLLLLGLVRNVSDLAS